MNEEDEDDLIAELIRSDGQLSAAVAALAQIRKHGETPPVIRTIAEEALIARFTS